MSEYWFTCPRCGVMGAIDDDQANARVSIQCPTEGCSYHETGFVRPLIPTIKPTKPQDAPHGLWPNIDSHGAGEISQEQKS